MPAVARTTGVAITNPLVLYRALLATKRIEPDPAQHRLALHLQTLYETLKDYEPAVEYGHRLNQISKALSNTPVANSKDGGEQNKPESSGVLGALFDNKQLTDSLSVTRVLSRHEEAVEMQSPRGLMLYGEVGTGKSMLIDLFADCLPNRKKKRWHFTTFMLEIMAKLEQLRKTRQTLIPASLGSQEDYSLLWLAREMISTSPILFVDEFQLPDRAANKIMTNLMTYFFHLGGVLIATSNRMPEELAKAAGMEFAAPPPPSRMESLGWKLGVGLRHQQSRSNAMYGGPGGDFARFLEVLKARCEVWQIEGGKDYRRRESEEVTADSVAANVEARFEALEETSPGNVGLSYERSRGLAGEDKPETSNPTLPKHYFVQDPNDAEGGSLLGASLVQAIAQVPEPISWSPSMIRVYGRQVVVPRQYKGVCYFTFAELCMVSLGPADYITLASTYHTLILTDVPILTVLQKNEARRFITLLDALYEARCKLLITATAGPDELFFPEPRKSTSSNGEETVDQDAILSETISDIYQDATAPFRPNISTYDPGLSSPVEPDFTHARLAGILSNDQLEDGPPNRPHRSGGTSSDGMGRGESIYGLDTAEDQSLDQLRSQLAKQRGGPNFQDAGIFTGEDEKFAYKRARSRLWEMCGKRWWDRDDADFAWWKPLDKETRRWEVDIGQRLQYDGSTQSTATGEIRFATPGTTEDGIVGAREVNRELDEVLYKYGHNASPFRQRREPPPKFAFTHVWGFMKWGKKAGAWGQGVEGLEERERYKRRNREEEDAAAALEKWKKDGH